MTESVPRLYVGTSGWAYTTWKPGFYPEGVSAKKFLAYYSSQLTSVEVNYTFASELKPGQLQGWLDQTPANFRFSFKAPQRITHFKRLLDCNDLLAEFLDSLKPAAGKLGLVLFQLPPNFKADAELLGTFLSNLRLGTNSTQIAFEFRHESWFTEEIYSVLREHNASLCIAESDDLLTPEINTASDFTCYRLRRTNGYSALELDALAKRFATMTEQRDVYVYFKHEDEPTGALNAVEFLTRARTATGNS